MASLSDLNLPANPISSGISSAINNAANKNPLNGNLSGSVYNGGLSTTAPKISGNTPGILPISNPAASDSTALRPGEFNTPAPKKPITAVSGGSNSSAGNQYSTAKNIVDNSKNQDTNLYNASNGFVTSYGLSQGAKAIYPNDPAYQTPPTDTNNNNPPPTAEDKIANAPDTGLQEAYNQKTGQREDQSIGNLPPGYTSQNPNTRTDVSDTANVGNGIQYKKFGDGTYGRFDSNDNYSMATAQAFLDAKDQEGINTKITSILNGTFKLPPAQQAQLDGIQAKYNTLIDSLQTENANTEGATTIAMNMAGIGNTTFGKGEVTSVVKNGINAIADLQTKLASDLATMTTAFEKDDMAMLKDSYDSYQNNQTNIQNEIDKTQANIDKIKNDAIVKQQNQNIADSAKYHVDIPTDATPDQALEIKKTSSIYKYEETTKGGVADPDVTDAQVKYYKTTGAIPTFSYGALGHAERTAFWSAVGGNPSTIIDATSNKVALHAATTAQSRIQTLKSGTVASISALKTGISISENEIGKLFKTGSPFLNKPLQWIQNQLEGNSQYAGLNQALSTVATEYAKIKNGASASIAGAPVTSVEEEKKLLNVAMSTGQLESTFDIIKQDSNGRLLGFDASLDSIGQDIKDLQTTNVNSDSTSSTSTGTFAESWTQ